MSERLSCNVTLLLSLELNFPLSAPAARPLARAPASAALYLYFAAEPSKQTRSLDLLYWPGERRGSTGLQSACRPPSRAVRRAAGRNLLIMSPIWLLIRPASWSLVDFARFQRIWRTSRLIRARQDTI